VQLHDRFSSGTLLRVTAGLATGLLLAACEPPRAESPSTIPASTVATSRDTAASRIFISHTGCRGRCPVYELTLFPDGQVAYHGIANVATLGIAHPLKYL
jgi:hypothetical protein